MVTASTPNTEGSPWAHRPRRTVEIRSDLPLTKCNGKGRQAGRDLHLHVDRAGLDALKGDGGNPLNHAEPACPLLQLGVAERERLRKNNTGTILGAHPSLNQA